MHKILNMGCFISYKWIFGIIGYNIARGKGFIVGFLFGWFVDSMVGRKNVHFTYRTFSEEDFKQYQNTYTGASPAHDSRLADAYKVLGISPSATDEEVRQAYRRLALRYHPDRVASQGEQERAAAERIFQQIGSAKDVIFKARGLK